MRLTVIGIGLMGGSLALSLKKKGYGIQCHWSGSKHRTPKPGLAIRNCR